MKDVTVVRTVPGPAAKPRMKSRMRRILMPDIKGMLARAWKEKLAYLFLAPFLISFIAFILVPVALALLMSLTSYDAFNPPKFVGFDNFIALITQDTVFMKYALPNTLKFAFFVGPCGYALSFFIAWLIYQLPKSIRDIVTLAVYAPSLAGGVALTVVWQAAFSGDYVGYVNNFMMKFGMISKPVLWLQDPKYLLTIMIIVTVWMSFGVGFLSLLAGLDTVNKELYEAGKIDGISSRLQEVYYITIPSMKPQMLFSAVMAIVGTLKAGSISVQLTGLPITPQYSGHLILNHIDDYAFIRFELGYASMVSVVLLLMSYVALKISYKLFNPKDGE
ncbi:carbohydrate ABC transporter membrane protein 1 (CUT1 family) [Paenibacillus sp. BK033]|uniref:carbohydrate ABC transporter permease n=1 Tax=Paenibacillus sp. BK033 TaxID=2512133 RepID=UPI0010F02F3C|nr:sugar ABC transporter permease [Paenibacillus sp. BK033]TCN01295.1 carbohydrate ABC transporter membrane protein 1 (CUT1 family) [Paenibacillus sp. BK033]